MPFQRFHEVNDRYQRLKATYGWLPEQHVGPMQQFWKGYTTDPAATLIAELEHLASHPQYSTTVRSAAARLLGMRGEKQQNLEPQYQTQDGQAVYTADQVQALIEQKLAEKLAPLEQDYTSRQQELAVQQVTAHAQQRLDELKKQPYFTEHQAAIKDLYNTKFTRDAGYGAIDGLLAAYNEVLATRVIPSLSTTERQNVLSELQTKAGASTVNPGRPAMSPPQEKPANFREALMRELGETA